MTTVARKEDNDPMAGLKTEWNREAKFIARDGTLEFTMTLPLFAPEMISANGKQYKVSVTGDDPLVYHEITADEANQVD